MVSINASSQQTSINQHTEYICQTDTAGRITVANDAFATLIGLTYHELLTRTVAGLCHELTPPALLTDLGNDLQNLLPWHGIVAITAKDGSPIWLHVAVTPLRQGDTLVGYRAVGRQPSDTKESAASTFYDDLRRNRSGKRCIRHGKIVSASLLSRLTTRLRNTPITLRFVAASLLALASIMTLAIIHLGNEIHQSLTESGQKELEEQVTLTSALIDGTMERIDKEARRLLDLYASRYPQAFRVERGSGDVPLLKNGNTLVNGQFNEEDAFERAARGPTATILVRRGDEFVRVATSQKNERGERIINTVLDKTSLATSALLAGTAYIGRTQSQGRERISALKPIRDEAGNVIGAFGIGYFIHDEIETLRERIRQIHIGDTGYVYVIDAQPGSRQGQLLAHPAKTGKNILDQEDASGRKFIREMLQQKNGLITYPWKNEELGENIAYNKIVAFRTLPRWGMLVGAGTYTDEFDHLSEKLRLTLLITGLLVIAALTLVLITLARQILHKRLTRLNDILNAIAGGNYASTIDTDANDELGRVMQALASMQTHLAFDTIEAKHQADQLTRIKIGLDNVVTNVRIADNNGRIVYVNRSLMRTFRDDGAAFQAKDPTFDPDAIVGYDVCRLYADPHAALNSLRTLTETAHSEILLGSRIYRVSTTPVINDTGERLGSIGEWQDITDQKNAQTMLTDVIREAANGNYAVRLQLQTADPFFQQIEALINQLLNTGEAVLLDLSSVLEAIARGDLGQQISAEYSGIFGKLKKNTNVTIEQLKLVIGQIQESSEVIYTAVKEIAAGNQNLSLRTEQQAASLEETASSTEELNGSIQKNAENARTANQLAQSANRTAGCGEKMVERVIAMMAGIQQSSHRIADIISIIDSIAFQTNILALNAAVEAARAGTQGRGFAVVATEVRNLAQRSAQSAREIRTLITDSVVQIDQGVTVVHESGATIKDLIASFEKLAVIVTEIAEASTHQSEGIDQISIAISQMDNVTQQNAALVEEAAAAAEALEDQARVLTESVSHFRNSSQASDHTALIPRFGNGQFRMGKPASLSTQMPYQVGGQIGRSFKLDRGDELIEI